MTTTVTAVEARQKLGHLLNLVSLTHNRVVIERAGKKIAILSEYNEVEKKSPDTMGKLDFRSIRGVGKEIWEAINVDEYLKEERDSWE